LKRLERLIQDVLLFARGEHIGREVIPVAGLLSEAAQTLGTRSVLLAGWSIVGRARLARL
jgi:hypothetical protein